MKKAEKEAKIRGGAGAKTSGQGKNAENKGGVKTEIIKPVLPGQLDIYKQTDDEGNVIYKTSGGREAQTDSLELNFIVDGLFDRLDKMRKIIFREDESDCFLNDIFESFLRWERLCFAETFIFVSRSVGTIMCESYIDDDDSRIVGAHLIPPDPDEQEDGPFYDVDPEVIELLKQIPPGKLFSVTRILKTLARGGSFTWYPTTDGDADGAPVGKSG